MWASIVNYVVTLVTFVAVDMVWLGTMASRFYKPTLGDIAISPGGSVLRIIFGGPYYFRNRAGVAGWLLAKCANLWGPVWVFYVCDV